MNRFFSKEIPFVGLQGYFVIGSLLMLLASVWFIWQKGLNWGTDFKGGFKLLYEIEQETTDGEVRTALESLNLGDLSVQRYGNSEEKTFSIKVEAAPEIEVISSLTTEALQKTFGTVTLLEENAVGPKAGKELRKKGILAIVVTWLLMLIYIGYRFDFYFAPGAILALVHDVTIATGAFALTQREIDLTVIAALLTIIGYSINDTIVVYDRVREKMGEIGRQGLRPTVNKALNETLSRTLMTSLTTLIVVVVLCFLSEGAIQNFAIAMTIGIIVGTYSSLFIATPCFIFLKEKFDKTL